jgi:two-component system cell cycle response regulator DivK
VVIISAKSLTAEEWERLRRYTQSIWQKGNFGTQELVSHVVGLLGDRLEPSERQPLIEEKGAPEEQQPIASFGEDRRARILVVDDSVSYARLLRRLFEARQRFEIVEAHTGAAAQAAVEAAAPDLIVLDLMLPDIAGEDLLERWRADEALRHVPIIVVTSKDLAPALRAKLAAHADSIWAKRSLDRSSLLAHVETILPM